MDDKKDDRFSNIWKDPRFKPVSKNARKVQIDKRFQSMFTDENFKTKFADKRGRTIQETSTENLRKFYAITSSSEDEVDDDDDDYDEDHDEEDVEEESKTLSTTKQKEPPPFDGADSGSTTSEESDLEVNNDEFDHKWGELQNDALEIDEPTNRIAVCNMNWDRIKAEDLLVLLNSFKPPDGTIHSVKIYPSEFGMQRMKEEEVNGPKELVEKVLESDEEDETATEEGAAYHREKLRKYQISRLRYYFAIVECDAPTTASAIYRELDGMEYESSAITIDLRFVPNDMTFEQEPSSMATSLPNMSAYKPFPFTTSALQQIKVQLTWDETDPRRLEAMRSAFAKGKDTDPENVDLSAFLASSSSEQESEDIEEMNENYSKKEKIEKYKELLQNLENEGVKENKDMELEITWQPGLQESARDLVKTKQKEKEMEKNAEMTPWENYLNKRKEKRKKKLKEKSQSKQDSNSELSDEEANFDKKDNLGSSQNEVKKKEAEMLGLLTGGDQTDVHTKTKIKKKFKKKREVKLGNTKELKNFEVNVNDPRFSALYTSHLYNIEPADPHFKNTDGTKAILKEKQKRRKRLKTDM